MEKAIRPGSPLQFTNISRRRRRRAKSQGVTGSAYWASLTGYPVYGKVLTGGAPSAWAPTIPPSVDPAFHEPAFGRNLKMGESQTQHRRPARRSEDRVEGAFSSAQLLTGFRRPRAYKLVSLS